MWDYPSLLCELAVHPDFPRFMANLEIYVNGVAVKQVQTVNAIVDTMSPTIMKQHNSGLADPQLRHLVAAHITPPTLYLWPVRTGLVSCLYGRFECYNYCLWDFFLSVRR